MPDLVPLIPNFPIAAPGTPYQAHMNAIQRWSVEFNAVIDAMNQERVREGKATINMYRAAAGLPTLPPGSYPKGPAKTGEQLREVGPDGQFAYGPPDTA